LESLKLPSSLKMSLKQLTVDDDRLVCMNCQLLDLLEHVVLFLNARHPVLMPMPLESLNRRRHKVFQSIVAVQGRQILVLLLNSSEKALTRAVRNGGRTSSMMRLGFMRVAGQHRLRH
jgi:hypothetical protein